MGLGLLEQDMKVKLLVDVYNPEPWSPRVVCFRAGQTVNVVPADNLPDNHYITLWVDELDPRTGIENGYGFALGVGDYKIIEEFENATRKNV